MSNTETDDTTHRRIEKAFRTDKGQFLASARRRTGSELEAEDIVQDVFLSALGNLEALANVQNLGGWIVTAIRNRVVDLWRRQETKRAAGESSVAAETIDQIFAATGLDPQDEFIRSELNEALVDAIQALPEEQRLVINAQVFSGLSFRELSEATGVSIDTLAGRKRYAIKALGIALRDWVDEA